MKEYPKKYGFVAMLDILGTSKCDNDLTNKLLNLRDDIIGALEECITKIMGEGVLNGVPRMVTFLDNIAFTWEVSDLCRWQTDKDFRNRCFLAFTEWLRDAIHLGLVRRLLWRGAMTVGWYFETSDTLLGPAVYELKHWYEKADWLGAIVTPSCQNCIGSVEAVGFMYSPMRPIIPNEYYVEYAVPLKDGSKEKLWAISWPYRFLNNGSKEDPERVLDQCFCHALIPDIPEGKRLNSIEFFKWYRRVVYPAIAE